MGRAWSWGRIWSGARLVMAAAIVAAIVAQLAKSVGTAVELGRDVVTTIANFFSFFTILSNAATAIVLLWAAVWFFTRGRRTVPTPPPVDAGASSGASGRVGPAEPPGLATALASATTYMVITGAVYNTLLRHIELPRGSEPVPWSNEIMHLVAPLFMLVDLFVGPMRRALAWRAIWVVVAFPLVWIVYTLVRGPLTTNPVTGNPWWYPYPFLDPTDSSLEPVPGYPGVAIYIVGIAVAIIAMAAVIVWVGRLRGAAPVDQPAVPLSQRPEPSSHS